MPGMPPMTGSAGGTYAPSGSFLANGAGGFPWLGIHGSASLSGLASLCPFSQLWRKRSLITSPNLEARQVVNSTSANSTYTVIATATATATATSTRLPVSTNGSGSHSNGAKTVVPNKGLLATCVSLFIGFGIVMVELL